MILVGLYASAISVSTRNTANTKIHPKVCLFGRSKLLGTIGDAEMHNEIEKSVEEYRSSELQGDVLVFHDYRRCKIIHSKSGR